MESHEEEKKDYEIIDGENGVKVLKFQLSDGRKVEIKEGTGVDNTEALKVCGEKNSNLYMYALISRVTTIDGQPIVAEDLNTMKLKHAMDIQAKFSIINL